MLILGEQHQFTELEIKMLNQKFKTIDFIKYKNVNAGDVINKISSIISKKEKTLIVLNTKALVPNELLKYLTKLEQQGIEYLSIQSFMEKYLHKCYIPSELTDISFLEKIQPFSILERSIKFIIDYSSAIFLLLLASPFMMYASYRIKKESPGPILFKQKRVGLKGKEFTCIKFRSMRLDAEKDGAQFATQDDDRIYSWGKTMRATRIDELPQLWNILKGDMHLIGPRPERQVWINQFEKEIPYYNERHIVKPGVTGWAQVLYPYGASTYDAKQKLMYDLYYIKHWNLWLEIKTVWKTILVVLYRKGL
jgi:exopolysaccharide biosynthesis polyprenyl glycosylphosphotransferase